jgi:YhzD-like protein
MQLYKLTAFEPTGEKILEQSFEAANDQEAKGIGEKVLKENGAYEKTHRCISPLGKLVLFKS